MGLMRPMGLMENKKGSVEPGSRMSNSAIRPFSPFSPFSPLALERHPSESRLDKNI
jgi:hypothetical protein